MNRNLTVCLVLVALLAAPLTTNAETTAERRERLTRELGEVEKQIVNQTRLVESKRAERQSLERDLSIIEGEIKQA